MTPVPVDQLFETLGETLADDIRSARQKIAAELEIISELPITFAAPLTRAILRAALAGLEAKARAYFRCSRDALDLQPVEEKHGTP